MGNPVHTAAQLRDELTAALDRLSLPQVRRKELAALIDAAGDIADQLAFIDENYYVLATDDGTDPVDQARVIFDGFPPGRITTESGLEELTAVSTTSVQPQHGGATEAAKADPVELPVAATGPLVPVTEVAKREDLRDVAAQVLASEELRAAMAAASFAFPTPLVSLRHVLLELAPVLVGNEWFPALSMTLRWALVGTEYQMADDETHGLVVGRRDTMAAPVADLTEADLSDPKVIIKVLGRHDLAFGQVPLIDYLRWLDSGRALPMPANSYDLVEAYVAQTGCNPRSIVMLSRTLVTTGLATFNDGNFALSMETSDPEHALQVVRRRVDEALEQHRWPDVTEVVDAITGIRRS